MWHVSFPTIINSALEKAACPGDSTDLLVSRRTHEFAPAFNTNSTCKFAEEYPENIFSELIIGIHLMEVAKREEITQLVLQLRGSKLKESMFPSSILVCALGKWLSC